jgi:hypothetical protein
VVRGLASSPEEIEVNASSRVVEVRVPQEPGEVAEFGGCTLVRLPSYPDHRGVLAVAEQELGLPFAAVRCFLVFGVPRDAHRGGHSLAVSNEVMIGVSGSITLDVDNGQTCWRVVLNDPTLAVHVPVGVWSEQHSFSNDAVLMVLASSAFDPDEFDSVRPGTDAHG